MPMPDAVLDIEDVKVEDGGIEEAGVAAVMAALGEVMDPELDASVTEMGFVESVAVSGGTVDVAFRLPTFWCSANFAYMMAADMKAAVEDLSFVDEARIRLVDHFAARKINRGVAEGLDFEVLYEGEAAAGLRAVRERFRQKAFLGRQERLLRALAERIGPARSLSTTMAGLDAMAAGDDGELRPLAQRYRTARRLDGGPSDADRPAFVTLSGAPVAMEDWTLHMRAIRRARSEAEANAALCSIQIEARYAGVKPGSGTALLQERDCND